MATVYHTSVTANVTFDEYLSPIGRVRDVLRHIAAQTGSNDIKITNRELAELAQCSAGSIPGILRTLEADGRIERIATRQGSLVCLCSPSPTRSAAEPVAPTRSAADRPPEHDQHVDRSEGPIPQQSQGSDFDRSRKHDQNLIPPCTPQKVHDHDHEQQQRAVGASYDLPHPDAAKQRLLSLGVWPEIANRIRAAQPDLTVAAIETAWRAAQGRRGVDPVALLTHCLITGQPIYSQEELHERRTANQRAAGHGAHQPKRSAGPRAGSGRGPAERPAAKPKPAVDREAFLRDQLELPVRR